MRRTGAACGTTAVAMFISAHVVGGQSVAAASPSTQVYNPYPPGILPSDLSSETARVQREVNLIEERALTRWHSLKKQILTGPPPVLQNTGTEAIETLGELMLYDRNISPTKNQACASCHVPYAGFSGPIPSVNLTMVAFPGTVHFRAGKRTPQRHPYSTFFPVLQYNQVQGPPLSTARCRCPAFATWRWRRRNALLPKPLDPISRKDSFTTATSRA